MVRCEEEENGENGEGGVPRELSAKWRREFKYLIRKGGRVCLVEGK